MKPTWAEVKARSVSSWGGLETYCGDCGMAWEHSGLPCSKHTTPEEQTLIDARVAQAMENLAHHPIVRMLKRRSDGRVNDAIAAYEAAEARMLALREQVSADREHTYGCCGHWPPSALEWELWQARKDHFAARAALQVDEVDAGDLDVPLASAGAIVVSVAPGTRRAPTISVEDEDADV